MMDGPVVLIIDDEVSIRVLLRLSLQTDNYRVYEASLGRDGLTLAAALNPDAIILDLGLPDMDGIEALQRLREWSHIPVIVVSVRNSYTDKVALLDAGADDYLTKPFSTLELLARLRAALRHRHAAQESPTFISGRLMVDMLNHSITVDDVPVNISATEYALLRTLIQNAGNIMTHGQLLEAVWGREYEGKIQYLRAYMASLRRKIEKDPSNPVLLVTEPGVGYRLTVNNAE